MKKLLLVFCLLSLGLFAQAGNEKVKTYVNQWGSVAVSNMQKYGIPASIILAQGILESGSGQSRLALEANNHFGIKCHNWTGEKIFHDDDKKQECFRKYTSAGDSYADHAEFLKGRQRYAFLFEYKTTDYKAWAKGLKQAGYATNPKYPDLLIRLIEEYELYRYDDGSVPSGGNVIVQNTELPKTKKLPKERTKLKPREDGEQGAVVGVFIGRNVRVHRNKIKYVEAKEGDRPETIAEDLELGLWQVTKYNDVSSNYRFTEGETVFIQPKRGKGRRNKDTVEEGEDLRLFSQRVGVKIKKIIKYNQLPENATVSPGQELKLRK